MTIVTMRLLLPADYGLMAIAMMFVYLLSLISELGLGAALIQNKDIGRQLTRQIFGLVLIANLVFCFLLCLGSPLIAHFFEEPKLVSLLRVLSVQYIIASFAVVPRSILQRELRFREKSLVEFIASLLGGLVTLLMALTGFGVWALVWGNLALHIVTAIGLNYIGSSFETPSFVFTGIRRELHFGGTITFQRILWFCYSKADILIIGKILGHQTLGVYSVAKEFAWVPVQKTMATINQVAFPAYSIVHRENEKIAPYFLKSVRIVSFIVFPLMLGISSLAPELVSVFLGNKWQGVIMPLQLLSLVVPMIMVLNLLPSAIYAVGRPDVILSNLIIAFAIMPATFFVGCNWGLAGVSMAWLLTYPFVFLIMLSRALPVLGIHLREFFKLLMRPTTCAILTYIAVSLVKILSLVEVAPDIYRFSILVFTGIAFYLSAAMLLNRNGVQEILGLAKR